MISPSSGATAPATGQAEEQEEPTAADLYDEGGVVTAGLVVAPPEHGAEDAVRLGAHDVVVSKNAAEMQKHLGSFDFILDTVSAPHDVNAYINLLKRDGTMTLVGAPDAPTPLHAMGLLFGRRRLAGSIIGGIRETQEMLDFCAEHNTLPEIEVIQADYVNEAYERVLASDVRYRFVIDVSTL